jgi:predicted SAM-dependent methyltransferase
MREPASTEEELQGFSKRVLGLLETGQPVKIQVGFGPTPASGFINLDIQPVLIEGESRFDDADMFYFPFADLPWPIPANCVDYIFHEDFVEHISQKQQVCFLAETLRVLKHGGWHRVSTPCLLASMRRHSRFADGMKGVYTGEWENWQHICLFTRHSLEEMARMVGYRDVVFNLKNQGVSPFAVNNEIRPGGDRHPLSGNIFADLLKLDRPLHSGPDLDDMLQYFDEAFYVSANKDVEDAVRSNWFRSGRHHYTECGFAERRPVCAIDADWYATRYPLAALEVAYGDYMDFGHHFAAVGHARGYQPTPVNSDPVNGSSER